MALLPVPTLDLTDKDFSSLRLRLQGLARSVFPAWTDFNSANLGNLLLELMAFVGDNTAFYQDAQARESFWPTLTRRISAVRMGRLINFTLTGAAPATGLARITIPAAVTRLVNILPGAKIRSLDPLTPLPFRTTNAVTTQIPIGQTFVDVPVEQTELITGELFESTGAPNQEFSLSRIPYLDGSAVVTATDGVYGAIDSFVNVLPTDTRKYVEVVDQNNRARIRFGNGVLGKIPQGTVSVDYKLTQGAAGNIEIGKLGSVLDQILDDSSASVSGISVTNLAPMTGGTDRMTLAQARALAPASLRALTRSITKLDFETHAQEVGGVARALMLTSNEDASVQENNGVLLIVALGAKLASGRYTAGTPSATMLASVLAKVTVEKPSPITFSVSAIAAPFKAINVAVRVYLNNGAVATTVRDDVTAALQNFFAISLANGTANTTVDFGANVKNAAGVPIAEIAWSDVMNAVRDVSGIRKVDEGSSGLLLNGLRQSVVIGLREFPSLGTVSIVNADTGLSL